MNKIFALLMLAFLFAILVVSIIYISKRFNWAFSFDRAWPMYIFISAIPIFFFFGGARFMNSTTQTGHIVFKFAAVIIGIYLFVVFSLLIIHFINIFYKFKPLTFGYLALGLALFMSVYGYLNSSHSRITKVEIPMPGLANDIKAVHLTDIHIGHFRLNGFLDKMVEKANNEHPDVVFITGDYLDSRFALKEEYFTPLKKLNAPIYFVDGNHDHATGNSSIISLMKKVGVNVLQNEVANFKGLQIIGLKHMTADKKTFDIHASEHNPSIEEVLPTLNINADEPSVILHHAPNGIKYADVNGVDLYLAGHTHAGQIFPFNFFSNLMFEYNRGLHTYNNTKVYVSEGIGTFGPPFRIGTKSEIISFTLKSDN